MYKTSDEVIKLIEETMKNKRVELTAGVKIKLSWGKNPKSDLPGRCAITITICDGDDATKSHS